MMLDRNEIIERYRVQDRAAPLLRANFISSLDGAATEDGRSGGLGNADDKLVFDVLRLLSDVIVVGAGTVRVEGYGGVRLEPADVDWRVAHGLPEQPPVAVVSADLDLDPAHPFFTRAATRPLVVTPGSSPADRRAALAPVADVLVCGESRLDPKRMMALLGERGLTQVLCEGGPHLFGSLVDADAVDELCLTLSPKLEGGQAGRISRGGDQATRDMELVHALPSGDMLFLRYRRRR